ncbi:MAG: DUF655 domain-containing protein [Burkholderiaceae bacterium]|nr:DUF655 domain-containing protein [Burkholderiaceae bacterium]
MVMNNIRQSVALVGLTFMTGLLASGAVWAAVDVNRADVQALQQVKGIGAKTAQRIVIERARGPFESLEHLSERLSGIGPKTIIKLKDAGLCAGTADKPCAKPESVSQVKPPRGSRHNNSQIATPQIVHVP